MDLMRIRGTGRKSDFAGALDFLAFAWPRMCSCLRCGSSGPARVRKLVLSSPAGGIIPLRKTFYVRLFLSILLPGRSAAQRLMHCLFADRFPLCNPVIRQLLIGTKTLRPRMKVYPGVFAASELPAAL